MIQSHIDLLGHKVKDKVTGFKGIVTSVGFDLYGCIQAYAIKPDSSGEWFDINRLTIKSSEPVMKQPNFETGEIAKGMKGPAKKSAPGQ